MAEAAEKATSMRHLSETRTLSDENPTTILDVSRLEPEKARVFLEISRLPPEDVEVRNNKLLRRIDWHLLPLMSLMYMLNILDRTNLSQARLGNLERDLNMKGTDFNTAVSVLVVGYLLAQLPSNLLLTRVRPSIYLSVVMTTWGVLAACQGAVNSFGSLLAVRVFLGFAEAPLFPGVVFLMSAWYTRKELSYRVAWFWSGNALANMFGGLLGAGVLDNLNGAQGIAGWRWLFIIEGVITVGVALTLGFIIPDWPATCRWLSDDERNLAQWRMLKDANEADDANSTGLWNGAKLAFKDYRLYLFLLLQHTAVLAMSFTNFFPSIVETLGYGKINSLLLTVPVWLLTFIVSLVVTWTAGKTSDRSIHIISLLVVSAIGNAIAAGSTNNGARFFAMFLMPAGAVAAYPIIVSWVANSFIRPNIKRAAAVALCNMCGNSAQIYGSYMYPMSASPRYIPGASANAAVCLVVAMLAYVIRLVHIRENKKLERREAEMSGEDEKNVDQRAVGFRYVY